MNNSDDAHMIAFCDCCVEYIPLSNFHHANVNYSCYYEVFVFV